MFIELGLNNSGKSLIIRGAGTDQTIFDGQDSDTVWTPNGGQVTYEDITIRNGSADGGNGGGAVRTINGGARMFIRSNFENNDANGARHGAISVSSGDAAFYECAFRGNTSNRDASVWGTIGIPDSTQFATFVNCMFDSNGTFSSTIFTQRCTTTAVNCTFVNNADNWSLRHNAGGSTTAINSVFDASLASFTQTNLMNNLFAGAAAGNFDGETMFVDPINNNYQLALGSQGIDTADFDAYQAAGGANFDLAGNARTFDSCLEGVGIGLVTFMDLGAVESPNDGLDSDSNGVPSIGEEACNGGPIGDFDMNGLVDLNDVNPFAALLIDSSSVTDDQLCAADVNKNGKLDGRDLGGFIPLIVPYERPSD